MGTMWCNVEEEENFDDHPMHEVTISNCWYTRLNHLKVHDVIVDGVKHTTQQERFSLDVTEVGQSEVR